MKIVWGNNEEYLYYVRYWFLGDGGFAIVRAADVSHAETLVRGKRSKEELQVYKVEQITNQHSRILTDVIDD